MQNTALGSYIVPWSETASTAIALGIPSASKLGAAASTTSRHLTLLADAGFLTATRKKGWTFYRRNEAAIAEFTQGLRRTL